MHFIQARPNQNTTLLTWIRLSIVGKQHAHATFCFFSNFFCFRADSGNWSSTSIWVLPTVVDGISQNGRTNTCMSHGTLFHWRCFCAWNHIGAETGYWKDNLTPLTSWSTNLQNNITYQYTFWSKFLMRLE